MFAIKGDVEVGGCKKVLGGCDLLLGGGYTCNQEGGVKEPVSKDTSRSVLAVSKGS